MAGIQEIRITDLLSKIPNECLGGKEIITEAIKNVNKDMDDFLSSEEIKALDENNSGVLSLQDMMKLAKIQNATEADRISLVYAFQEIMEELLTTHREIINEKFPVYKIDKPEKSLGADAAAKGVLKQQLEKMKTIYEKYAQHHEVGMIFSVAN